MLTIKKDMLILVQVTEEMTLIELNGRKELTLLTQN